MVNKKVYLDNSTTTRMDPLVLEEMLPFLQEDWGSTDQTHWLGRQAKKAVDCARERIAHLLGIREEELIFTSGGTEANNLAILGVARAYRHRGNHIITSKVEHPSVLLACKALELEDFQVTYLPVTQEGLVEPVELEAAMQDKTILVSIIYAEAETGAVQPIHELSRIARSRGVLFHTDASLAVGKLKVSLAGSAIDLLSLSAHKFHGPKGVGALFVRSGTRLRPILFGVPEAAFLRPGTENIAAIVGLARALELAIERMPYDMPRIAALRDMLYEGITAVTEVSRNGPTGNRLHGCLNLRFHGLPGESLLYSLDLLGVALGAGNPCVSGAIEPSYVLLAQGLSPEEARSSLRFFLARENSQDEISYVVEQLARVVQRLKLASLSGCSNDPRH
ncbi:MAG: cysteine desulfurase family protein [Candidatus Brocadiales bacterium]|nr:cysteine desulfurase family protein [Candidatus Brocadiales bacterium]